MIWARASKAKLQKEFFLMQQRKTEISINLLEGWNSNLNGCEHYILVGVIIAS